nr:hypothetical protein [Tanacetum cinerariifolium]
IDENGVTRPRKYSELTPAKAIQADCDVKATNIILQGLPPEVYVLDIPIMGWIVVENKRCGELMIDNHWMDKLLKKVLMTDWLGIVETDKVNHIVDTYIVKLVVEIENFSMSSDECDKETGSSDGLADELDKETRSYDGLQPKQADLSCIHALNELHLHEIHVSLVCRKLINTNMVKLVVEIKSFGMRADELDKETRSYDGLQPKQADLSCIHALNEFHLHEIHVSLVCRKLINLVIGSGIAGSDNSSQERHHVIDGINGIITFLEHWNN